MEIAELLGKAAEGDRDAQEAAAHYYLIAPASGLEPEVDASVSAVLLARLAATDRHPRKLMRLGAALGVRAKVCRANGDHANADNIEAEVVTILNEIADAGDELLGADAIKFLGEMRGSVSDRAWLLATGRDKSSRPDPFRHPRPHLDWDAYLHFRPGFAEAVDEDLYPMGWLDTEVLRGAALFWHSEWAAILAELKRYPSGAVDIHGLLACGRLEDITEQLIPRAESWAREAGCAGSLIASRDGWARALKNRGYAPFQSVLRKVF
jgi:hypothetical protein